MIDKKRKWRLPPRSSGRPILTPEEAAVINKARSKKLGFLAASIVFIGVGICLWAWISSSEVDHAIAQVRESHTCSHCGHVFELTIGEATSMRRAKGSIVCPSCEQPGAQKIDGAASARDASVSSPAGQNTGEEAGSRDRPKRVTGGKQKNGG